MQRVHLLSVFNSAIITQGKGVEAVSLSEKKKASNAKWDAENLKRMSLAVPCSLHDRMKEHTEKTGETMNGFVKRAIMETLEKDEQNQ